VVRRHIRQPLHGDAFVVRCEGAVLPETRVDKAISKANDNAEFELPTRK
jgi:hypothetical protein